MSGFKLILISVGVVAVALLAGCKGGTNSAMSQPWYVAPNVGEDGPKKVGLVRRPELLVAYYTSVERAAYIDALTAKRDAAVACGDTALAKQCEAEGEASQDHAHRQLAGKAPLTDIIESLADVLPSIASETGVDAIHESGTYRGKATTVDITDAVIARIPKDKRYKKAAESHS